MVREALWRPPPSVEAIVSPFIFGVERIGLLALFYVAFLIILFFFEFQSGNSVAVALCVILVVALGITMYFQTKFRARLMQMIEDLAISDEAVPCICKLSFSEAEYGRDYGVLQVSDGYLHFFGSQVELSISNNAYELLRSVSRANLRLNPKYSIQFIDAGEVMDHPLVLRRPTRRRIPDMFQAVDENQMAAERVIVTMPLRQSEWLPKWFGSSRVLLPAALQISQGVVGLTFVACATYLGRGFGIAIGLFLAWELLSGPFRALQHVRALRHTRPIKRDALPQLHLDGLT